MGGGEGVRQKDIKGDKIHANHAHNWYFCLFWYWNCYTWSIFNTFVIIFREQTGGSNISFQCPFLPYLPVVLPLKWSSYCLLLLLCWTACAQLCHSLWKKILTILELKKWVTASLFHSTPSKTIWSNLAMFNSCVNGIELHFDFQLIHDGHIVKKVCYTCNFRFICSKCFLYHSLWRCSPTEQK